VAVLGPLVGFPDLVGRIGALGGRVVYEEWRELAAEMEEAEDWAGALACGPLVAGLPARLARLRAIAAEVQAAILVTEPFCALAMEETFFRRVLIETRLPMLVLEAEGYGPMDAARVTRLEAFAEAAMKNER
jgi:hypothetical protein